MVDRRRQRWPILQDLISRNSDIALFAIAAGNGGPSADGTYGAFVDPNWATSVSGVAKLENYFTNVMSVGALEGTNRFSVGGLSNPWSVNIASYSNRGYESHAHGANRFACGRQARQRGDFNGTSAANPNMAGIASLVWSVNTRLTPEGSPSDSRRHGPRPGRLWRRQHLRQWPGERRRRRASRRRPGEG